jgi:two-component system, cell cycle sensor histidine kinase and response regulator CckA
VLGIDRMLRRLIGEDVELVTIMAPDLGRVLADPGQIEQVLVNLAVNARDAMPGGGTLTLRTANVELTESNPRREPDTVPGPYARLSVTDTGSGMDAATAARVFEPFFTTKDAGKGTGLGLATCYGIVKQARGQITFDTAPGSGCTFHIDLPLVPASGTPPDAHERPPDLPAGHETILLVEDEAQVRRLAASILRQRGYDVLEAASGHEALRIAEGYASSIDVLVTDVVMPQMRGTEVARLLREQRPAVKVLFMSGYTEDELLRRDAGGEGTGFLGKPFSPAALARRVRALIDGAPGD